MESKPKDVILSGMRPTGRLHLGHYEGALKNYLAYQEKAACFFMVADWHALTSEYAQPGEIARLTRELVVDWLAVGLDPERAVLFVQSDVAEHAELYVILGMLTPLAWAERCPTYKEQQQEIRDRDLSTYGFLGYPILQAADILLYRATQVPIGQDQLPHVEMTREIARRFNHLYGEDVLPEPASVLTPSPRLPGLDGRKMSKSYGNTLDLADETDALAKKVMRMYTDPQKLRADTPGHPDHCVVLAYYRLYRPGEAPAIEAACRAGRQGCVACKRGLVPVLDEVIGPIRARRAALAGDPERIESVLAQGRDAARRRGRETLARARKAMGWRRAPASEATP